MFSAGRRDATLTRVMGAFFALGSGCFVAGPTTTYTRLVGGQGDALTFFGGSILFTLGGLTQCLLATPERRDGTTGRATWRTAWIQSVGTFLFNVMTLEAITVGPTSRRYDWVVWPPNVIGSACFLISGTILYWCSPRRGLLPRRRHKGWWEAAVNLLGCVLFGVSAAAGFVVGTAGAPLSQSYANWTTTAGAGCFLICALTACGLGFTLKAPRLRQLRTLERELLETAEREALGTIPRKRTRGNPVSD
jgi:drug/metabolite transporter (DMT)-like permease